MKLQKQRTREVKGKEYHRWTVIIPPEKVRELGWKEGDDLDGYVEGEKLVLSQNKKNYRATSP